MHYYQFNIGDYASHTSRLTPLEDVAYRRMLDVYYLSEQPLNGCATDVAREIGMTEYLDSVEYILAKFFIKEENCFSQKRIDSEIKKYKSNAKNKSKAGKASAKARRSKALEGSTPVEQTLNTKATTEQLNINHKPLTINQETVSDSNSCSEKKPNVKKSKYNFNDDQMNFAKYFQKCLKEINPNQKEPNYEAWANDVRLLNEVDKRDGQLINSVWEWARKDSFWQSNLLSPSKFRKQFDALVIKLNQVNGKSENNSNSTIDVLKEIYNEQQSISSEGNGQIIGNVSTGGITIQGR